MDGRYSIGTNNRYALFLGEEDDTADPQNITKLVAVEKARIALKGAQSVSKNLKSSQKENKDGADQKNEKKSQPGDRGSYKDLDKVKNSRTQQASESKTRSSEGLKRDDTAPRGRRRDSERREGDGEFRERPVRRERQEWNDKDDETRQDRRGAPLGKPRPRQISPNNRRKREFERRSGSDKTGVKHVDKREGSGAHNWGTVKDDLVVSGNLNASDVISGDETDIADPKPETAKEIIENKNGEKIEDVAEELEVLTLDEYRAMRKKRQQPKFNLRQAGEGEDLAQWKDMVEMKKKKNTEESDEDEELENIEFPQRVGRQKHVLDIDITFKDARRGGRAGRGGIRDREQREKLNGADGYRKFPVGTRRNDSELIKEGRELAAPRVDDEKAFPSLG